MKKIILFSIAFLAFANLLQAQNPCYIKYTYDASGNRIKREFICAPVDSINGSISSDDDDCCPGANVAKPLVKNNITNAQEQAFNFDITPNPATNELNILLSNKVENLRGAIFNNMGQELMQFDMSATNLKLDLSKFSSGVYYIAFQTTTQRIIKKFVKTQ
jgi:Secretion system C-terminal sorting domain